MMPPKKKMKPTPPKPPKPTPPKPPKPPNPTPVPHGGHFTNDAPHGWNPANDDEFLAVVAVCLDVLSHSSSRVMHREEKLNASRYGADGKISYLISRNVIGHVLQRLGRSNEWRDANHDKLYDAVRKYIEDNLTTPVFEHYFGVDGPCYFGEAWVNSMFDRIFLGIGRDDSWRWTGELVKQRSMELAENLLQLHELGGVCEIEVTGGSEDDMQIRFIVDPGYVPHTHAATLLFLSLAYEREHAYCRRLTGETSVTSELQDDLQIMLVDGSFICKSDTFAGMCLGIRRIPETDNRFTDGVDAVHSILRIVELSNLITAEHGRSAERRTAAHRLRLACPPLL